jgi:DNA-binding MarR family transcriptional regulator
MPEQHGSIGKCLINDSYRQPYQTYDDLESALIVLDGIVNLVHKESFDGEICIIDEIEGAILLATRQGARQGYVDQATADTRTLKLLERHHFIRRKVSQDGASTLVQPTPEGFRAIELYRFMKGFDRTLRKRCFELILERRFDTAIREASLLLESRLRDSIGSTSWGVSLVNEAFGSKGKLAHLFCDDGQRQGMRDLMAGTMAIIRNDYAHNFRRPGYAETTALFGFINMLLERLNDLVGTARE